MVNDSDEAYLYRPSDPHYEVICSECRYGGHDCRGKVVISGGVLEGSYWCACHRCTVL